MNTQVPMTPGGGPLHYRPDIDGLRAVAVISVLGFHLRTGLFYGGFVGVDVFFVISGYLIGSIILKDLAAGKFSLTKFYERRVRRIFPALIAFLLGTTVLAYFFFLPTELVAYAKSLLAALFSMSNVYFWTQSGYFSAPAETKPLLHTWSLGIEEQFYVFLPVFLYLGHRYFPRRLRLSVVFIALTSFALSTAGAFRSPVAGYFLLHSRAWELMLGVLIAMDAFPRITGAVARNLASAAGLALIAFSVVRFSAATPFPGVAALAPCMGAALVIIAGNAGSSVIQRALSLKPVVFVGLISYSLYLWHWPIIVFQGLESMASTGVSIRVAKLISITLSFVLATLSWKFVEMPFRNSRNHLPGRALIKLATASAAVVATVGLAVILSGGLQGRYPARANRLAAYLDYDSAGYFRDGSCFLSGKYTFSDFNAATCLRQDPHRKNFLLFGDSHAAQLWYGLSRTLADVNVMQATAAGCRPTLEQVMFASENCTGLTNYIYNDYLSSHHVDRVLIADRWQMRDLMPLSHALDWMKARSIPVVVFGPMVQYDAALPRLLAISIRGNNPSIPDEHRVDEGELESALARLAQEKGVQYVSLTHSLCGPKSCQEFAGDVPLQFDYGHLTKEGSVLVAQKVSETNDLR